MHNFCCNTSFYITPETFEISFDESAFKDFARLDLDGEPEVKSRILSVEGEEVGTVGIVRGKAVDFRDIFVSATGKLIAPVLDPEAAATCPGCGVSYRSGFPACSDCQVPVRPLSPSSVWPLLIGTFSRGKHFWHPAADSPPVAEAHALGVLLAERAGWRLRVPKTLARERSRGKWCCGK